MFSVEKPYRKVVDNFIILLVLKSDSHKSDRLEVMLFINSVTESVQLLYRFQRLNCLLKLLLQSCRRFETGGSLSRRVSVLRAPAQMGRARGQARRGERRGGRSRA
jgi:hypothetical protein